MTGNQPAGNEIQVHIELISWVNGLAGGPGSGSLEVTLQVPAGTTVRQVLKQYSAPHAKLREALWDENDREEIGPHLEVIVNNAILGVHHELGSPLADDDRVLLTGQFIGG